MSEFVNTIDLLGDEAVTKALIERTLTEFNDDTVRYVGRSAFYSSTALTGISLPSVTEVGMTAFSTCTSLKNISLPLCTKAGSTSFAYCSSLEGVVFPLLESVPDYMFRSCESLKTVDFPSATRIGSSAFDTCRLLSILILRSSSICTLGNRSAFEGTPFASGKAGGTLLVPRALTESYPTATNWSSIMSGNPKNRVLALEDYTVDGTITGAIDWDKLNG